MLFMKMKTFIESRLQAHVCQQTHTKNNNIDNTNDNYETMSSIIIN